MAEDERSGSRSLSLSNPAVLLFLAAQTVGGIWWAATTTAEIRNLGRAIEVQDIQRQTQMEQFRQEMRNDVNTLKADVKLLETYNQNLRERLASRGIIATNTR